MDHTWCILIPQPLQLSFYCYEWSPCFIFTFLESLQYLQREKCYNASSYCSLSLNRSGLFSLREAEYECVCIHMGEYRCVCMSIGHGHLPLCPVISLLARFLFLRLPYFGDNCFRKFSSLIHVLYTTQTTTQKGRVILCIL